MAFAVTFLEPGSDATQDFSFFATTAGAVSSSATFARTGPRSLKFATGAGPTTAGATSPVGVLSDGTANSAVTQVSTALLFDSLPAAVAGFWALLTSVGLTVATVNVNATGTLALAPAGATLVNGTTVLAINTWYVIGLAYTITNTTTFRFDLFINDVLELSATAGTLTRTASSIFQPRIGSAWGTNRNLWIDDIYVATGATGYGSPGLIQVTAKRPNANGTTNGFTTQIGAGGSGYGSGHSPQVNEEPLSQTNGWSMIGAGSAVTEEYNVENRATGDVDITGGPIVGVRGWVFAKSLANETAQIVVDGTATNKSLTSTPTMFTQNSATPTTFPAGSGTDVGIITATDLTTVSLYEAGILVAFQDTLLGQACL